MANLKWLARALVVVAALMLPAAAHAQSSGGQVEVPGTSTSVDFYRAAAVTAGVVGGAIIAAVATEGLIVPVLAYGGEMAGVAGAIPAAGTELFVNTMRLFGAVAGGFYADAWYAGQ